MYPNGVAQPGWLNGMVNWKQELKSLMGKGEIVIALASVLIMM